MRTLGEFVTESGMSIHSVRTDRENRSGEQWAHTASHWRCVLRFRIQGQWRRLATQYSMGSAIAGTPDVADVLRCLLLDASAFIGSSPTFGQWCDEYGYEASADHKRTYLACKRTAERLDSFLPCRLAEFVNRFSLDD
jgi:hypothetical protein